MIRANNLRAAGRVLERATIRVRTAFLDWRLSRREARAERMILCGEAIRELAERVNDSAMAADGFALIDKGAQLLNEIETGQTAEPRPATWWQHRGIIRPRKGA